MKNEKLKKNKNKNKLSNKCRTFINSEIVGAPSQKIGTTILGENILKRLLTWNEKV